VTKPTLSLSWSSPYEPGLKRGVGGLSCSLNLWLNPHLNKLSALTAYSPIGDADELSRRGYSPNEIKGFYDVVAFKEWTDKSLSDRHEVGTYSIFDNSSSVWKNSSKWIAKQLGTHQLDLLFETAGFKTRPWRERNDWTRALLSTSMYEMKIALGLIERAS